MKNSVNIIGAHAITLGKKDVAKKESVEKKTNFAQLLEKKLKLTKHAEKQINYRGITIDKNTAAKLDDALNKLSMKGVKSSLVLSDNKAFLLNVKERKVITAMNVTDMKEKVFTNIDGVMLV